MMIRQSQPPEDTQTLLQTIRQDRPVVRRTDVQPRQWQICQISSLERQLKHHQRAATPRRKCQDITHHGPQEHRRPSLPPRQSKPGWVCRDNREGEVD